MKVQLGIEVAHAHLAEHARQWHLDCSRLGLWHEALGVYLLGVSRE